MNECNSRSWRQAAPVVGVILIAGIACFWPLFQHPFDLLVGIQRGGTNDLTSWYLPHREYPLLTLTQFGQFPFWNPWVAGGTPFFGSFQTAVFYPPNWIFWFVPARSLISWDLVVHHLIAASGAYFLSRRLGASRLGATFASVIFGVSPILIARTGEGHLTTINTLAWYPWAFLAYQSLREGGRWSVIALLTTLALCFLAGHPQEFYYLILTLSVLCLVDMGRCLVKGRVKDGLKHGLSCGLTGMATAGLVAAELIPLAVYLSNASAGARLKSSMPVSPGPSNLVQMVFPFANGGPAFYWGPGSYFWETICYFGLIPSGLAALGGCSSLRAGKQVSWVVIVGLGSFVLAFGEGNPLHELFATSIPGYSSLRCPGRWLLMSALVVAILAAFGVDEFARPRFKKQGRWKRALPLTLATLVTLILLSARLFDLYLSLNPTQGGYGPRAVPVAVRTSEWVFLTPLLVSITGLGCAWLSYVWPTRSKIFAALLLPMTLVELAVFANAILTTLSPESFPRDNPALKFLSNRNDGSRICSTQFAFTDEESFRGKSAKFQGYDPLPLDRTIRFASVMLNPDYPLSNLEGFYKLELKRAPASLLNLWGIRYIIAMSNDELPAEATDWKPVEDYQLSWSTTPRGRASNTFICRLWENPGAIPRGFVVGRARTISGNDDDLLRGLDPRKEVLLERDILPAGPRQEFTPARRIEDTPNRVALEVEIEKPGYLVLADSWYPGWTATVDDQPATILHADLAFRAIALPKPGRHLVVFRYFPPGLIAGLAISTATVAGLVFYAIWLARRRLSVDTLSLPEPVCTDS